jgi:hypothetical protein
MALFYHTTIQYGGPIDVIVPVVAGLVFLGFAVLEFKGGAQGQRQRYDPQYYYRDPRIGSWWAPGRLAWLRPRRVWPERYDGLFAILSGITLVAFSAMFFSIAVSVVLE